MMSEEAAECGCFEKMVDAIGDRVQALHPEASDIQVRMEGYGTVMNFASGKIRHVPTFPIRITYKAPKKRGGMKTVRMRQSGIASFCPFCGKRYPDSEGKEGA